VFLGLYIFLNEITMAGLDIEVRVSLVYVMLGFALLISAYKIFFDKKKSYCIFNAGRRNEEKIINLIKENGMYGSKITFEKQLLYYRITFDDCEKIP